MYKRQVVEPTRLSSKAKWILFAVLLIIFLVTTCSPIVASLVTSLTKVYGVPFGPGNITFDNFLNLTNIKNIARAFQNSAVLDVYKRQVRTQSGGAPLASAVDTDNAGRQATKREPEDRGQYAKISNGVKKRYHGDRLPSICLLYTSRGGKRGAKWGRAVF